MVKVKKGQTLLDIAIQETGNVANAYSIAVANNISVTAELNAEHELVLPIGLPTVTKDIVIFSEGIITPIKVKVKKLQTFFDLSVRWTGNASNAYSIALANGKSVTDMPVVGEFIFIPANLASLNKVIQYYEQRDLMPATGLKLMLSTTTILDYEFPLGFPISF